MLLQSTEECSVARRSEMGVQVKQREGKSGWWVFINHDNKRRKRCFSDKKLATEFAKKIEASLKWAKANGQPVSLFQEEKTVPTVREYLGNWLYSYVKSQCKFSTAAGYRQVSEKHI